VKFESASIEGFRAFTERVEVDLSADVTVLVGPNGTGKTSLLDALLWGITGRLKRVAEDGDRVLSLYSPAGLARVALTLSDGTRRYVIVRTLLEGKMELGFGAGDGLLEGPLAEAKLVRTLWDGSSSQTSLEDLHEVMTRSVYLQQDLVRQFVDRDSAAARFDAIGRLVGVGRIAEFQRKLEASRKAWATVMSQKQRNVADAERRLEAVRSDLARIGADDKGSEAARRWTAWWTKLADEGLGIRPIPEVSIPNPSQILDEMLRALQTTRNSLQRKLSVVPQIRHDLMELPRTAGLPDSGITKLRAAAARAKAECDRLQRRVSEAEQRDATARTELVAQRNTAAEMRTLAQLALRHLSAHCPVCEQSINAKTVEARLKRLVGGDPAKGLEIASQAPKTMADFERASAEMKKAERELQLALDSNKTLAARRALLKSQLLDLELKSESVDELERLAQTLNGQITDISEAYKTGEELAPAIVRLSEQGRREDLSQQELRVVELLKQERASYEQYKTTHEESNRVVEAVRSVADDAVSAQIEKIGPLLGKIYTRIDPHPTFRVAKLESYLYRGQGRVETPVVDPRADNLEIAAPAEIFSSSQTNALAVSIFLAMNLATDGMPLQTAILDDPLQSLDSINVLGLLDVLRRARQRRQLLLSTHDENFAALLMRKFRPVEAGQRTSLVTLRNWERSGVRLEQSVNEEIPARLQVVS
jgi:DNA repair exonuclease SbcCD ATPase subunit